MATHFNRKESQEICETIARIEQGLNPNSEEYIFKGFSLNSNHVMQILPCCYRDATGFYFNALISFAQGLHSISKKQCSWAAVQLYYSVYYACRAILGFDKYIIIRKGDLFLLKVADSEKTKKLNNRNDHKMTLDCYKSTYKNDYLLSNNIDNIDFYSWIADLREITQYKQNHFREPDSLDIFKNILSEIKSGKNISHLLDHYSTNWNLYCFQKEFAVIAAPYYLINDAHIKYLQQTERITISQRKYIEKLFKELKGENIITNLL